MTAHNFIDLTGKVFGKLTVVSQAPKLKPKIARWHCKCSCGGSSTVDGRHLREGKIHSCGCAQSAWMTDRFSTHGKTNSPEYKVWCGIKRRCFNQADRSFPRYGGRGITMCDEWKSSFQAFLDDMGPRPSSGHSIDRIDNNAGYAKDNCQWANSSQQAGNRRDNLNLVAFGKTLSLSEWARQTGVKSPTIKQRLMRGWAVERAVSEPPDLSKVAPRRTRVSV